MMGPMQYSTHPPTPYLTTHTPDLLPDWSQPIRSVLLTLQWSRVDLSQRTPETERMKASLRMRFLQVGQPIVDQLHQLHHLAVMFDPSTGQPLGAGAGLIRLDDVAIAHTLLGYPRCAQGGCALILHPTWGTSVYPSTLVSSAPPQVLQQVAQQAFQRVLSSPKP